jgi:cysteine-rich repeat protein
VTGVSPGTWTQAESAAVALGGYLVTVNDVDEQDWLIGKFPSTLYWIGFYQDTSDPEYAEPNDGWKWIEDPSLCRWLTGNPSVCFTNFSSGEPNEAGGGTENFAAMNAFSPGKWQDVPDGLPANYVGIVERVPCPDGQWCQNPANNHWYRYTQPGTWQDAEDEAVLASGHLVTINDQAEHDWVVQSFPRPTGPDTPLWIGLYQDCNDAGCCTSCVLPVCCTDCSEPNCTALPCEPAGSWKWISGEPFDPVTYENWRACSPNNGQLPEPVSSDCGEMYHSSQATDTWTDRPCAPPVSQPGLIETTCGDGLFDSGEECDDGNKTDGDGCSSACLVELGYSCKFEPSTCEMCKVAPPVPTVSEWGLIVIGLLILTGGTAVFGHRRLMVA